MQRTKWVIGGLVVVAIGAAGAWYLGLDAPDASTSQTSEVRADVSDAVEPEHALSAPAPDTRDVRRTAAATTLAFERRTGRCRPTAAYAFVLRIALYASSCSAEVPKSVSGPAGASSPKVFGRGVSSKLSMPTQKRIWRYDTTKLAQGPSANGFAFAIEHHGSSFGPNGRYLALLRLQTVTDRLSSEPESSRPGR